MRNVLNDVVNDGRGADPGPEVRACRKCGATTHYGKPYCTDHVGAMPYVASLVRRGPVAAPGAKLRARPPRRPGVLATARRMIAARRGRGA